MKPRAIICDVYRTILDILPPPEDAEQRWDGLHRATFGEEPPCPLREFFARCRAVVRGVHEEARARGVASPEVQWPQILRQVLPGFAALEAAEQMRFQVAEQGLWRGLGAVTGSLETLQDWSGRGLLLGIASNAQAYTGPELASVLATAGLTPDIFAPDLCVWSWQAGFSKPDPYFFQTLLARLTARNLSPGDVLMVGDRADNDIAPARAAGLMTWHLHPDGDGNWQALRSAVRE